MRSLPSIAVEAGLPHQLVPHLNGEGLAALDPIGPEGWGTPPGGRGPGSGLLAADPAVVFRGGLEALREARRWLGPRREADPDAAVLIGALGYELGSSFGDLPDRLPPGLPDSVPPVLLFGYEAVYRSRGGCGVISGRDRHAVRCLAQRIRDAGVGACGPVPDLPTPEPRTSDAEYRRGVRRIQEWIAAGDVYQVNLSRRLDFRAVAPDQLPALYDAAAQRGGAPFSAYLHAGDVHVLSVSPERFLRVVGNRIETCPIKGTRPRGHTPEEDEWRAKELLASAKDRAEHVMIVDLERNDLGRVCRIGSIRVERLAALRSFASVHHLVSSVQGELADPDDWLGLLAATFPGGSITGAPKLRAMEIIQACEPVRRGVYTGAIGCFDAAGGIDLSIAIRTAVARAGDLFLHVGGGIVADSRPEAELAETRDKARALAVERGPRP